MTGRGNGLSASSWAPIADLDTLLVAPVLEELRQRGIAAYAEPSRGTQGAYLEVRWHDRPTDRLFVDAGATTDARTLLNATLPSMRAELESTLAPTSESAARSDDEVWAELVASFDETPSGLPPWPVAEDLDGGSDDDPSADGRHDVSSGEGPPDPTQSPRSRSPRLLRPAVREPEELRGASGAPTVGPAPVDPIDHYVPPEPPPLPRLDMVTRLAWCGVVGGPLLVLLVALLRDVLPTSVAVLPVLAFVAGFVTLVARMRERPSDLDGPDDGAVV